LKVVSVFSKYILSCEISEEWDEAMARYVVSVLLDHYNELFQVPVALVTRISEKLCEKKKAKISRPFWVCHELYLAVVC